MSDAEMPDFGSDEEPAGQNQFDRIEEVAGERNAVSIHFCTMCANMLYPLEDRARKKLLLACRNCGHKTESNSSCVYRNELIKDSTMKLSQVRQDCINDVTLQRTGSADCEKCGGTEAVFFMTHDDTMKVVSVCRNCGHKWIA